MPIHSGRALTNVWLPPYGDLTHPTRNRYRWMIDHYNAVDLAIDRELLDTNPPIGPGHPGPTPAPPCLRSGPPASSPTTSMSWGTTGSTQRYTSSHTPGCVAARPPDSTGATSTPQRSRLRGPARSLAAARIQTPVKTRTSPRRIDLDAGAVDVLERWRQHLTSEGAPIDTATPMFLNQTHVAVSCESISQLFTRTIAKTDLPHPIPSDETHPQQ